MSGVTRGSTPGIRHPDLLRREEQPGSLVRDRQPRLVPGIPQSSWLLRVEQSGDWTATAGSTAGVDTGDSTAALATVS